MVSTTWIIVGGVVLVGGIFGYYFNRFATLNNRIKNSLSQINVQLKRRADLIPNLIETVKGYAKHEKGDFKGAIADFSDAIRLKASYPQAFNNRAASKLKLEDYEGAVDDCNKALILQEDFAPAYLNRGIAEEMLRKEDQACEDWQKAASLGLKNGKLFSQQSCN